MVTKTISKRFQHSPIKTVGGVCKSAKKCTKMTSLSPVPVEPLFGRPQDLCPEVTFSKMHIRERFREDRVTLQFSHSLLWQEMMNYEYEISDMEK